jgi:hypothetical protein
MGATNLMKGPAMPSPLNMASPPPMPFASFNPATAKGMGPTTTDLLGLTNPTGPFNGWSLASSLPMSNHMPRGGTVSMSSPAAANLAGSPGTRNQPDSSRMMHFHE